MLSRSSSSSQQVLFPLFKSSQNLQVRRRTIKRQLLSQQFETHSHSLILVAKMGRCSECKKDSSDYAGYIREKISCPKLSGEKCNRCHWEGRLWVKCCGTKYCNGKGYEICRLCKGDGVRDGPNLVLCSKRHDKKEGKMSSSKGKKR